MHQRQCRPSCLTTFLKKVIWFEEEWCFFLPPFVFREFGRNEDPVISTKLSTVWRHSGRFYAECNTIHTANYRVTIMELPDSSFIFNRSDIIFDLFCAKFWCLTLRSIKGVFWTSKCAPSNSANFVIEAQRQRHILFLFSLEEALGWTQSIWSEHRGQVTSSGTEDFVWFPVHMSQRALVFLIVIERAKDRCCCCVSH